MAFFNYSTMQMTAKIVYYGPGLGGKTTNLEFIHGHTTDDSRGEMVSLETQSDRTLFFDLLPMEVGKVAGFRTRIQLYTVPGQVFYNTTRKLVLKGVDGLVFVADSQRPMLQANIESLANLGQNLEAIGRSVDTMPLVLQYNKRDLHDVLPLETLERSLNSNGWDSYEASALHGNGVFETLRGISRLTLLALKRQLESESAVRQLGRPASPQRTSDQLSIDPAVLATAETAPVAVASPPDPAPAPEPAPAEQGPPPTSEQKPPREAPGEREPELAPEPVVAAQPATPPTPEPAGGNGRLSLRRELPLTLGRAELDRASRILVDLRIQDADSELVHEVRDVRVELEPGGAADELQLHLNIAFTASD